MLFRKRRKPGVIHPRSALFAGEFARSQETFVIEREMMLKGAEVPRRGRTARQFAVMINGSVHVVTSGDTVDRTIYDALVAANAITPLPGTAPAPPQRDVRGPAAESTHPDEE